MKTTVCSYRVGRHYILRIDGHSDCDVNGANPVCACVSVLVAAMWHSLPDEYKDQAEIEPGHARFDVRPSRKDESFISKLFCGVIEGLKLVEKEYPGYIEITSEIHP